MFIFNPEHDLCIANGDAHFVPPASALAFGRDCGPFMTKYMEGLERDAITPWGWNHRLRNRLLKQGIAPDMLPSDCELSTIRTLSDRQVAVESLYRLYNLPEWLSEGYEKGICIQPDYRITARTLEEVETFLQKEKNIVLKAPLSGSGKGLRFVREFMSHSDAGWCRNLLSLHGELVAERRLNVVEEFAMLFEVGDRVCFKGYSLFYANNGIYSGNLLASDNYIERRICKFVDKRVLENVRSALATIIEERFLAAGYKGFVGVDQFVYNKGSESDGTLLQYMYNPLVEFNVRMTMGLIARNIYDRFRDDSLISEMAGGRIGDGSHIMVIQRNRPVKGSYSVALAPCRAHTSASC